MKKRSFLPFPSISRDSSSPPNPSFAVPANRDVSRYGEIHAEVHAHLISGSCTSMRLLSGTPRRQSAMSSSPSVEQPVCSPIFVLRSFGSWTDAQGLSAEPLDNTTRWNNPVEENGTVRRWELIEQTRRRSLCGTEPCYTTYTSNARRIRQDIISFRPIKRKRRARRELRWTVIILAWIIRGGGKYDRYNAARDRFSQLTSKTRGEGGWARKIAPRRILWKSVERRWVAIKLAIRSVAIRAEAGIAIFAGQSAASEILERRIIRRGWSLTVRRRPVDFIATRAAFRIGITFAGKHLCRR